MMVEDCGRGGGRCENKDVGHQQQHLSCLATGISCDSHNAQDTVEVHVWESFIVTHKVQAAANKSKSEALFNF